MQEFESCIAFFEHFITTCALAEPLLLRSSFLRVLAKAAGLGGGMGSFLMNPIGTILENTMTSSNLLHDARKMLELLVPLSYQPAIKAAILDSSIPANIAKLIGAYFWSIHLLYICMKF